jgi:hypothetical protein
MIRLSQPVAKYGNNINQELSRHFPLQHSVKNNLAQHEKLGWFLREGVRGTNMCVIKHCHLAEKLPGFQFGDRCVDASILIDNQNFAGQNDKHFTPDISFAENDFPGTERTNNADIDDRGDILFLQPVEYGWYAHNFLSPQSFPLVNLLESACQPENFHLLISFNHEKGYRKVTEKEKEENKSKKRQIQDKSQKNKKDSCWFDRYNLGCVSL